MDGVSFRGSKATDARALTASLVVGSADNTPDADVVACLYRILEENGLRVEIDDRSLSLNEKVESATVDLVPFQFHLADVSSVDQVRVRSFDSDATDDVFLDQFVAQVKATDEFAMNVWSSTCQRLSAEAVRRVPDGGES
ncbi:MAG: His/Gly/Thr/Pro-type tRNA ligase C-terminal domain-containing protein [Pseudonocardiales bacterium]